QTFTELYTNKPGSLADAKVTFEVAEGADTPALESGPASFHSKPDGLSASASANVSVAALPPGRYVIRALITASGRAASKIVRPFLLLPNSHPVAESAPAAAGAANANANTMVMPVPGANPGLLAGGPAAFYLGACYAAAGRDRDALTNWERARANQLQIPSLPVIIAEAYLRLGQPAQALAPLSDALARQPQNDAVRKSLAIAQSTLGQ